VLAKLGEERREIFVFCAGNCIEDLPFKANHYKRIQSLTKPNKYNRYIYNAQWTPLHLRNLAVVSALLNCLAVGICDKLSAFGLTKIINNLAVLHLNYSQRTSALSTCSLSSERVREFFTSAKFLIYLGHALSTWVRDFLHYLRLAALKII